MGGPKRIGRNRFRAAVGIVESQQGDRLRLAGSIAELGIAATSFFDVIHAVAKHEAGRVVAAAQQ